ncbi:MAG: phosphate/phosphite/phosphonate ABC transporter substrate-binding protein [Pantoea sp.]|nr:phosphate/phosphite/phosphonate ABC transporter substrate-binding protein [Pantoea sp.]
MKLTLLALLTGVMTFGVNAADAPKELNLGILGGQNATQQIGDNQCVKDFFDKELKVDTKLRNSSDYAGVIQGLLGGKIDMVLSMSPASYASVYLQDPKAVDIVGILVDDKDGSKGYHSVVIVKNDSPYKKLEDLKGKSFGMADPDSTSGFLMPNQAFKKAFGGSVDDKYNGFFSSVTFSGGHEQDILGVLNNQFDGAVTWTSLVGDYGPLLVSNKLPADFKQKVVDTIQKLDKEQHACFVKAVGGAQHIGPATVADYQNIIDMKRDLAKGQRG